MHWAVWTGRGSGSSVRRRPGVNQSGSCVSLIVQAIADTFYGLKRRWVLVFTVLLASGVGFLVQISITV